MVNIFGSDPDNTRKLKEEISGLQNTVSSYETINNKLRDDIQALKDRLAAQAEATDVLAEKAARFDMLQPEIDRMAEELKRARARVDELEGTMPLTPPPFVAVTPQPAEPIVEEITVQQSVPVQDFTPITDRLDKIEKFMDDNSYKDSLIRKLHADLTERSGDFMGQIKRPYLKSIIRIHERLSNTLASCDSPDAPSDAEALAKTLKKMRGDILMVQDLLDDEYDVEYYLPAKGDKYEPRLHNALSSLPAPTPDLAGTIAECRTGGFVDQNTGKAVKPATVTVYKVDNK